MLRWSEKEELILKDAVEHKIPLQEVAKRLNRTNKSVSRKKSEMGLKGSMFRYNKWFTRSSAFRRPLSPTEVAYLAGIVDGEGTITIIAHSGPRQTSLRPTVIITNCSSVLMDWLQERFKPLPRASPMKGDKSRQIYQFGFHGLKVGEFLETIIPYLTVKRRQAELVKAFVDERLMQTIREPISPSQARIFWEVRYRNIGQWSGGKRFEELVERLKKKDSLTLLPHLDITSLKAL